MAPLTPRPRRVRHGLAAVALLAVALAIATTSASAQPAPPELTAPVNDFAGVIDAESRAALDTLSRQLLGASGDTLVVATVRTTKEWGDIRAYATKMFENGGRGIGQKGKDNGLLVLLAVDDRQVWVEVGYDLEGLVTDGFAGETSREVMTPHFRSGAYGAGLLAGSQRLAARIAQGRNVDLDLPAAPVAEPGGGVNLSGLIILLFILFFIVIPMLKARQRQGAGRRWRGHTGSWGGGYSGDAWGGGASWGGGGGGGFGGFGGGRSGGGGGGASW